MKRPIYLLGICIGLLLGVGTFYLARPAPKSLPSFQLPEEYMKEVQVISYNKLGQKQHTLKAFYWTFRAAQQQSSLTHPELVIYKPNNTQWIIQAHKGLIEHFKGDGIKQVFLSEQVTVERPTCPTSEHLLLKTNSLTYEPKTAKAYTRDFVEMRNPQLKITGKGMKADLNQNIVELLENVQSLYQAS